MREMNKSWEEKLLLAERMREEHAKRQEALGVVDQVQPDSINLPRQLMARPTSLQCFHLPIILNLAASGSYRRISARSTTGFRRLST